MASSLQRSSMDYGSAGVHDDAIKAGLDGLVQHIGTTWPTAEKGLGAIKVGLGHFASVLDFGGVGVAVCTDGIGTKALIAQMMGRYDTVGIDCVAMNVNDLVCVGAQPITLVDYIAVEKRGARDARSPWSRASPRVRGWRVSPSRAARSPPCAT